MEEGSLGYHLTLDYAWHPQDRLLLPRVLLSVEFARQSIPLTVSAILDTGAQLSVLDGGVVLPMGWTVDDIVERSIATIPIHGIGPGPAIPGYLHEITAYLGGYARYAELKLRVLVTPPDRLEFSVLGRSDFFEQVDVTFAERDKRLYFRFHDPKVLRSYAS